MPTVTFPEVLEVGVTEKIALNVFLPVTVAEASGPASTSVCALPSISRPVTVNKFELSSSDALVIVTSETVFGTVETIQDEIFAANAPSTEIEVTLAKTLVPVAVSAFAISIVSVWVLP